MFSEVFCATSRSAASFSFSRSSSTKLTILVAIIFNARYSSPISLRLRIGSERISFNCSSLRACGTSQNWLIDDDIRMIGDTMIRWAITLARTVNGIAVFKSSMISLISKAIPLWLKTNRRC